MKENRDPIRFCGVNRDVLHIHTVHRYRRHRRGYADGYALCIIVWIAFESRDP